VSASGVLAALRDGVVGGMTAVPPEGKLVGTVSDSALRGRLPVHRFAPVLEVSVLPAGRGALVRARVRRNALVLPLLVVLTLLEVGLLLVCVVAVRAGQPAVVFALPVLFGVAMLPVAGLLLRVSPADRSRLEDWLDARLASASVATGAAP
jgi:hypothetical protein